ncbi:MAG: hypothetical protein ABIY52_11840 [Gemmatimonadaceae bacterium]
MKGTMLVVSAVALHASLGCAQQPPAARPATPAIASADTNGAGIVPSGYGRLKQEAIAVELRQTDLIVRLTPLDESVIRTLAPDSYRALRDIADSRRTTIERIVRQRGLQRGNLWYVQFFGLATDARFSPLELTIASGGHEYRPIEVIPLTARFGEQRVQPRETQAALYLFEDALDVNQPLTISLGSERTTGWTTVLRNIEKERASIRSRTQQAPATP